MSYNLKNYENQWLKIDLSIDNVNGAADLFINGTIAQTFSFTQQITKNSNSKLYIGSKSDKSNGFNGKIESFGVTNKLITEDISKIKFEATRSSKNKMFDVKFVNNSVSDRSKLSKFKLSKRDNADIPSTGAGTGIVIATNTNRDAVQFSDGKFIEMDATESINGNKLMNTTFSAWIKTPSLYTNTGYEPILSRNGIFSFGLNNGHASLFLGKDNQLVPGTNITAPEQNTDILATTDYKIIDLSFEENNERLDVYSSNNIVPMSSMTQQKGLLATKSIHLAAATNDKMELAKSIIVGKDLSKFSVSMWVNFDTLTNNMILMERPEIGLKLSGDSTGKLKVAYNTTVA